MAPGTPGGMGVDEMWFPLSFAVTDVNARALVARVEALATPTSVATTTEAAAEGMLAYERSLVRVTWLTDGNLLSVPIGGNPRRLHLRRRACGGDWEELRTK
jgi:hypothetical protein